MSTILWNARESDDYIRINVKENNITVKNEWKRVYKLDENAKEVAILDVLSLLSDVMFMFQNLEEVFISFDRNILIVKSYFKEEKNDVFNFMNLNIHREDIINILGIEETIVINNCLKQIISQKPIKKDYFPITKMIDEYMDRDMLCNQALKFHDYFFTLSEDEQKEVFVDFIASLKIVDSLDTYSMKKSKKRYNMIKYKKGLLVSLFCCLKGGDAFEKIY